MLVNVNQLKTKFLITFGLSNLNCCTFIHRLKQETLSFIGISLVYGNKDVLGKYLQFSRDNVDFQQNFC